MTTVNQYFQGKDSSDKIFYLIANLMAEIKKLPKELQVDLDMIADQILEEVYAQASFERMTNNSFKKQ